MLPWINNLLEKWSGWIGDADLQRGLRAHLSGRGYYGDTAKFLSFRLVAIQRPGWLQVYSFAVEARVTNSDPAQRHKLFGLVRQDERYKKCDIEIFSNSADRQRLYLAWSEDLIRLRQARL